MHFRRQGSETGSTSFPINSTPPDTVLSNLGASTKTAPPTIGPSSTTSGGATALPSASASQTPIFDEVGNIWLVSSSDNYTFVDRTSPTLAELCPTEFGGDGNAIVLNQSSALLDMRNTTEDFNLYLWPESDGFSEPTIGISTNGSWTYFLLQSLFGSLASCPYQLNRTTLGDGFKGAIDSISLESSFSTSSILLFNATIFSASAVTVPTTSDASQVSGIGATGEGSSRSPDLSPGSPAGGDRKFDLAFIAIPAGIALAFTLGFFALMYERRRRKQYNHGDGLSVLIPENKYGGDMLETSSARGLLVSASYDRKDSLPLNYSTSSLIAMPPLPLPSSATATNMPQLPSPVARSPIISPRNSVPMFRNPFTDEMHGDPMHDLDSAYEASEFVRASSHNPSEPDHLSSLRRSSSARSGSSYASWEGSPGDDRTLLDSRRPSMRKFSLASSKL